MPVDDLWYSSRRASGGGRTPTKRQGRGKRWRVRWVDDVGRSRQKLFDKRAAADRFDAEIRASVNRGQYVDPSAGKITVTEYAKQWRSTRLHRDSTVELVERALRLHVEPILGRQALAAVKPSHIQAWVRDRTAVLEPSTLRVTYSYVASLFGSAALDRLIGASPCVGIVLPEVERSDLFVPSVDQVAALAGALPGRYAAQPFVVGGTGLRQGEVWGLELGRVDFLRRTVEVVQQLKVVAGRKPFLAPPKTRNSRRTVELSQVVAERLARHLEAYPPVEVEIQDETNPRQPRVRTAKLVFTNASGNPISRFSWSHTWAPAAKKAGLPPGAGFHALRHLYATLLIYGGANVKTVQLALGHANPMITLNTYVGLWPDAVDTTRSLVDAAFGRPAGRRLEVAG